MPPLKPSSSLRVLVVEDHVINQHLVEAFLLEAGHLPILAASGGEALAILERQSCDVVLMDVEMPGMDGFQTTAAIRARESPAGPRLPILAMTAHSTREDRDRCMAAGMDGHIAKPMRFEELIELIESAAPGGRRISPAERPPGSGIERPGVPKELSSQFVDDASHLHIEMREAFARLDGESLRSAAHTLCGTAGFFKARTVEELARRLEYLGKAEDFGAGTDRVLQDLAGELARLGRSDA